MPHIVWQNHTAPPKYRAFIDTIAALSWTQHVRDPTRLSNILDLFFTQGIPHASASVLESFPGSDHNMVRLSFKLHIPNPLTGRQTSTLRQFHRINWDHFASIIRSLNWDSFFLTTDIDNVTQELYNNLELCINVVAPKLRINKASRSQPTAAARKMHAKLRKLRSKYQMTKSFHLLLRINEVLAASRSAQALACLSEERKALSMNNKAKAISQLMRRRSNRDATPITSLVLSDNSIIHDPIVLCDIINKHFSDSFSSVSLVLPNKIASLTDDKLCTIQFDLPAVYRAIRALKLSFYPGPDGIPSALLVLGGPDVPLLLLNVFNLSMKGCTFPTVWKHAIVVPRHKRGCRQNIDNYRPISHTPIASRMMERIIKEQMLNFLLPRNLINRSQHGFLPSKSCTTCQLQFLNHVTQQLDRGRALLIIFLDMKKAFDRVPHPGLLTKLASFGISGQLLSWFASYLANRTQSVRLGGVESDQKLVTSGVFQGSVLGPLLFLLYVNDVFHTFRHGTPYLFADDIKVVFSFNPTDLPAGLSTVRTDLQALESWCDMWKLEFSPEKCHALAYRCTIPTNALTLSGIPIGNCHSVRDLGVRYSNSLNFAEQVSYSSAKARSLIAYIFKSMSLMESRLTLYKVCVRPLLEYCSIVFTNSRKRDRIALENVQRSFTKRLISHPTLNYRDRCLQLKLDPLWLRRIKSNLIVLFRVINNTDANQECSLHTGNTTRYPLRNRPYSISLPMARSNIRNKFFIYRYASVWNKLPLNIRASRTIDQFRSSMTRYLNVSSASDLLCAGMPAEELWEHGPDGL